MPAIVTLTLNPALDVSTAAPAVRPTIKVRCETPSAQAGGGGINVARVARRFGGNALALFPSGGVSGARVAESLASEAIPTLPVPIKGETRESFTVTDHETGEQFRFVLPGPTLSEAEEAAMLSALSNLHSAPQIIVVSGSFPPGLSPTFLKSVGEHAAKIGATLIVDGPREVLTQCHGASLIKPNLRELETIAGRPLPTWDDQIAFAKTLRAEGVSANVLVSLGEDGALLITEDEAVHFTVPPVTLVSAVGAGDSMVGALVAALVRGDDLATAALEGAAAGTAALLTPGTELCHVADAEALRSKITVKPVLAPSLRAAEG
ncbi:MAG: 1-phosphofructokinase family hexose kinase [Pseudomonadota bacterium]